MAINTLNPVIDCLRKAVLLRDGAGLTDGQMLESFVSQKDESAFEGLVRRHGPMVLSVCRRVLRNHHYAEDAFQATFLILARKADSIVPREMVANWLYGVGYRTALKARSMIAKQSVRERQVTVMPEPEAAEPDHFWRDLQPLLDQELSRLPDKYRVPVVLCDFEGKTGKDAAQQLGWPEGTVASRLSRGRVMLGKRLTRRGLALSGGSLAATASQNLASASVPATLLSATIKAGGLLAAGQAPSASLVSAEVIALTEGGLKAMFMNAQKFATLAFVAAAIVGLSACAWIYGVHASQSADEPAPVQGAAELAVPPKLQPVVEQRKDGEPLLRVPLPERTMMTVKLSANGKLLAVAPHDKTTVELWDVATGKQQTLKGHAFSVISMAFSPDGKTLATGTGAWLPDGAPGEIKLWDVATGKERAALGRFPDMIVALTFSPDGKTLASVSKTVKLWDVSTGKECGEVNPNDGKWLTFTYGNVVHRVPRLSWSAAFSPDGKTLAVGVGVLEDDTPGAAILYDVGTGKVQAGLPGHKGAVACVAFTPDGKTLVSADSRGTLKLWDVAAAKERVSVRGQEGGFGTFWLQSFTVAGDGKTVMSTMIRVIHPDGPDGRSDCVLKEWDVADGKERTIYRGTFKFPIVVSGDGAIVGLASSDWEAPGMVGPGGKMELLELRSLRAARTP